jgi:hypothetical protein
MYYCKKNSETQKENVRQDTVKQTGQFSLPLAPQPSLGLGLLHKIQLNFVEASQQFSFLQGRVVSPTPIPMDQASVFISPRGRVATYFSRLLRHAWVTVGLFLFPRHHKWKTGQLVDEIMIVIHQLKNIGLEQRK